MKREIIYADNINDIPNGHIAATVTRTGYVVHEKNLKENPLYILVDFERENDIDIVERTIYLILAGADVYNRIGVTNLESYLRYEVVYVNPYHDKDTTDHTTLNLFGVRIGYYEEGGIYTPSNQFRSLHPYDYSVFVLYLFQIFVLSK